MKMKKTVAMVALVMTCSSVSASRAAEKSEVELLTNIARDGLLEVDLGKLAEKKATNADVKAFARHMVRDHSDANAKLKQAADKDKVELPNDLTPDQKKKEAALAILSGDAFDKEYISEMCTGHDKAVDAISKETHIGSGNAKKWADDTLPTIKEHKKEADQLKAKIVG
jgi:putative membrane protein